jgi:hypothetical protein
MLSSWTPQKIFLKQANRDAREVHRVGHRIAVVGVRRVANVSAGLIDPQTRLPLRLRFSVARHKARTPEPFFAVM